MAQRPPRMPRANVPEGQHTQPSAPEPTELPTDAINVVQAREKAQQHAPRSEAQPRRVAPLLPRPGGARPRPANSENPATEAPSAGTGEPVTERGRRAAEQRADYNEPTPAKSKLPMHQRAKEKQSARRRTDRMKFSGAVRRNPEAATSDETHEVDAAPVAAHKFSGRFAGLLVVLVFFAVLLVPTVNYYRTQNQELTELRETIASLQTRQDELKDEIARWDDPLYIKQQARERINLVQPGEKVYKVVGAVPEEKTTDSEANGSTFEVRQELPWVDALLDSVRRSATD
ncbi:hypothetical protein GCM10027417_18900 [Glutamicibacter endophyticus]